MLKHSPFVNLMAIEVAVLNFVIRDGLKEHLGNYSKLNVVSSKYIRTCCIYQDRNKQ